MLAAIDRKNCKPEKYLHMKTTILLIFILAQHIFLCSGQSVYDRYFIRFTDKQNTPYSLNEAEAFLSPRAIQRREKQGIEIRENDLPVNPEYVDSLRRAGFTVLHTTKWFNGATVIPPLDFQVLTDIENWSFVQSVERTRGIPEKSKGSKYHNNKWSNANKPYSANIAKHSNADYGYSENQLKIVDGDYLHQQGYKGVGMHIAILDAGFYQVNSLQAFTHLFENNQILGTKDFVDGDDYVYDSHSHGMKVLSVMGGLVADELLGTAPEASFWLLRTEDVATEYLVEEDNWVVAAEFADSVGADIINSSLGYSIFFDPSQDHTYNQMDGNSTRITIAADIAASKGMIVVTSAGNEGNDPWQYITAPADADSILAVGAVDDNGDYVYFSSLGPTADNRVKPDVMAKGYRTVMQLDNNHIGIGNGTSFASPVIAGLTACLWQALPGYSNIEIIENLRKSATLYYSPTSQMGYGIPDFAMVYNALKINAQHLTPVDELHVYPNPFRSWFSAELFSENNLSDITIELFDVTGKRLICMEFPSPFENYYKLIINGMYDLERGVYILRMQTANKSYSTKIAKQ